MEEMAERSILFDRADEVNYVQVVFNIQSYNQLYVSDRSNDIVGNA